MPEGPLATALAWVHPALMFAAIGASLWVLSLGLRIRSARVRQAKRPKEWFRRHVKTAKAALLVGLVGLVLGPLTWVVLRGEPLLSTLHGKVATGAALIACLTWAIGRRLERGRANRDLHAFAGILAVLVGLVALLTGLELLP